MIDVMVYKPSPNRLVFINDKPLGFIIYYINDERGYVFKCTIWFVLIIHWMYSRICFRVLTLVISKVSRKTQLLYYIHGNSCTDC